MRLVLFGVGQFYEDHKMFLSENDDIVAFVDNDCSKWGKQKDGIRIHSPNDIYNIKYDYIVISSIYVKEIKEQLIAMEISCNNILFFEHYKQIYFCEPTNCILDLCDATKSVLFVFTYLCNDGGTMAIWNAAKAFLNYGYNVYILAMGGTEEVTKRIEKDSIEVVFLKRLDVMTSREMLWIERFNLVIVNTFLICNFAFEASKIRKIIWWLHDPKISYLYNYEVFCSGRNLSFKNIYMMAVSNLAKRNFNSFFPEVAVDILPYYISKSDDNIDMRKQNNHLIFSYVGTLSNTKGIDILLDAFDIISDTGTDGIRLCIVGTGAKEMVDFVKLRVNQNTLIEYKGEMDRDEINQFYSQIDVLICPSREDMLPTVVVEAMQHKKLCIVSDGTGIADYIENKTNGLIFENENIESLIAQIKWTVNNRELMDEIGSRGHNIYRRFFSENSFDKNIFSLLNLYELG